MAATATAHGWGGEGSAAGRASGVQGGSGGLCKGGGSRTRSQLLLGRIRKAVVQVGGDAAVPNEVRDAAAEVAERPVELADEVQRQAVVRKDDEEEDEVQKQVQQICNQLQVEHVRALRAVPPAADKAAQRGKCAPAETWWQREQRRASGGAATRRPGAAHLALPTAVHVQVGEIEAVLEQGAERGAAREEGVSAGTQIRPSKWHPQRT